MKSIQEDAALWRVLVTKSGAIALLCLCAALAAALWDDSGAARDPLVALRCAIGDERFWLGLLGLAGRHALRKSAGV